MTSTFHDYYMEVVTSSFGDDLDHIRQVWQWSLHEQKFLEVFELQVKLQFLTIIVLHWR